MKKESHIQWALYDVDSRDYYISLEPETLNKIKDWNIIKSKIVYSGGNVREMVQKKLFISLLNDNERRAFFRDAEIVRTKEAVWLRISNELLDALLEKPWNNYEHRYDTWWNKIHFIIDDDGCVPSDKEWFDNNFQLLEKLNKPEVKPEMGDLFEAEYVDVYNKPE